MILFAAGDDDTELTPEEQDELIPDLTTKAELNEWERLNILEARRWALASRNLHRRDPCIQEYALELHRRMFDQTWQWAGRYRNTEKNIGIEPYRIREGMAMLLGNLRYWLDHRTFEPDEIAVRVHHRMVWIHPFANGNGRHARLLADVLAQRQQRPVFTWGSADAMRAGDFRQRYIAALRAADRNEMTAILRFARS